LLILAKQEIKIQKFKIEELKQQRHQDELCVNRWKEEMNGWEVRWREAGRESARKNQLLQALMREVQQARGEGGREEGTEGGRERELEREVAEARKGLALYGEEIARLKRLARRMEEEGKGGKRESRADYD